MKQRPENSKIKKEYEIICPHFKMKALAARCKVTYLFPNRRENGA